MIFVRSTWEKRVVQLLDMLSEILRYSYEPFSIPYKINGVCHNFIPDLLIEDMYGITEVWEIKRQDYLDNDPITKAKIKALFKWCRGKHNCRIVTLKDIETLEEIVSRKKRKELVYELLNLTEPVPLL